MSSWTCSRWATGNSDAHICLLQAEASATQQALGSGQECCADALLTLWGTPHTCTYSACSQAAPNDCEAQAEATSLPHLGSTSRKNKKVYAVGRHNRRRSSLRTPAIQPKLNLPQRPCATLVLHVQAVQQTVSASVTGPYISQSCASGALTIKRRLQGSAPTDNPGVH